MYILNKGKRKAICIIHTYTLTVSIFFLQFLRVSSKHEFRRLHERRRYKQKKKEKAKGIENREGERKKDGMQQNQLKSGELGERRDGREKERVSESDGGGGGGGRKEQIKEKKMKGKM